MSYLISQRAGLLPRRAFFQKVRHAAPSAATLRPLARILVSEDDPAISALYGAILTGYGFEYLGVPHGDGWTTLDLARRARPQLLITDLNKPGLDGATLRATLRASPATARLPILVISAMDPWGAQGPRPGPFDDYLLKPFLTESLIYKVAALLPLDGAAHDRLAERALAMPCYERAHPVTGHPCLHVLSRGLAEATAAPGWGALGVSLAHFPGIARATSRAQADGLLARLGGIVARATAGGLLVGHSGLDAQIAIVGPAPLVAAAGEAIVAALPALRRYAEQTTPQLPPLRLLLRRADATAGLGLSLQALRAALRG